MDHSSLIVATFSDLPILPPGVRQGWVIHHIPIEKTPRKTHGWFDTFILRTNTPSYGWFISHYGWLKHRKFSKNGWFDASIVAL